MMKTSLLDIIESALNSNLKTIFYENNDGYSATVVLSAQGYPNKYEKGFLIEGLNNLGTDLVFHAGTSINNKNEYITSGGRILNVVGFGDTLDKAISDAYRIVDKIKFKNMHYRKDIGKKGLNC